MFFDLFPFFASGVGLQLQQAFQSIWFALADLFELVSPGTCDLMLRVFERTFT